MNEPDLVDDREKLEGMFGLFCGLQLALVAFVIGYKISRFALPVPEI